MSKKLSAIILSIILVLSFAGTSLASDSNYVTDETGILENSQKTKLNDKAKEISLKYNCGVYIIVLQDYLSYLDNPTGAVIKDTAEKFYFEDSMGMGKDKSGIMLMLSMSDRDYILYAHGYGNTAFTDYGKNYLADSFLGELGNDNWYKGFDIYLNTCNRMLESAYKGRPVDVNSKLISPYAKIVGIIACVILGFITAFIVKNILLNQLKSVAKNREANQYIADGGLKLIDEYDRHTHTTQKKVYDPPQSKNSSKSSGGTTVDSKGSSSKSGKF